MTYENAIHAVNALKSRIVAVFGEKTEVRIIDAKTTM